MKRKTIILACLIVAKFLLQYILISPQYDLHRDEYLHLDQGNHLAWGYSSVPPATSWISVIIHFLGNGEVWVKFFPALFGALTIIVVWKAIEALNGNLFALILGSTCVLFSVLLRLNQLYQPNSLDVLCWTSLCFILIKFINSQQPKWLFAGAVIFALGFLNKYNIVFLVIGLLPALLITKQRLILLKKEFYFAIILALLLVSPNLVWQYNNNFPVVHHLKELADTQLVNVSRWGFLKEQFLYFFGALPVIFCSLYALLFYTPFKKYRFFFWAFIFTLLVFVYLKAKGYYAIGLYFIYIPFGAVFIENYFQSGWKKNLRPIFILLPIIFFFLLFNLFFSNKSPQYIIKNEQAYKNAGLLRWEDGKDHRLPQDFADMLGWKELAMKVDTILSRLPNKEFTLILCDNYGQAGAINYYTKNEKIKAVSFNADYINWFNLNTKIYNFVRVKEFNGSNDELKKTSPFFDTSFIAGTVENTLAREYGTTIFVFSGPKVNVNQRLKDEIDKQKKDR